MVFQPAKAIHHASAQSGYIATVEKRNNTKHNAAGLNGLLSKNGISMLIISSLVFLTMFAWIDIVATAYRNFVLHNDQTKNDDGQQTHFMAFLPLPPQEALHHTSSHVPKIRTPRKRPVTEESLTVKQRIGYAILLSFLSMVIAILLRYWVNIS